MAHIIWYIKNTKDSIKKNLLQLINRFNKVSEYKINTQKPVAFLYTNTEQREKEIKKKISIYNSIE
jgi:DNA gyrase inhibitor GyrI